MIEQVVILTCGLSTVFLSTAVDFKTRRVAAFFGMVAQPFWLWDSWHDGNWGVFILSLLFAFRWTQVFIRDWIKNPAGPLTASVECNKCGEQ